MNRLIKSINLKIRRRETPFYDRLFRLAKAFKRISVPCIPIFHAILYNEWRFRITSWHNFWRVVYYEPMFKSQCVSVGKNFTMQYAGNGSAKIHGDLQITFGDNVIIFDNTTFAGMKIFDKPELIVGDNVYLGPLVRILVGTKVTIGSHCLIGSKIITDNPGHSTNVMNRLKSGGGSPEPETFKPIVIGDFCWLPLETVVYPGTTIGDGVVALMGTHLRGDIPPFCQVAGNPMKIIRKLPIPDALKDVVGEDRFNSYLKSHAMLEL